MLFAQCSVIQEGDSILFYHFNRQLNGYVIAGVIIGNSAAAKLSFAKIWKYFVSEVVTSDDIYCSIMVDPSNTLLSTHVHYHSTVDGRKIYKVDNAIKDQYSTFTTHIQRTGERNGRP